MKINILKKVDTYLLKNFPHIWETRIVLVGVFSLIIANIAIALFAYSFSIDSENVPSRKSIDLWDSIFVYTTIIIFVLWIIRQRFRFRRIYSKFEIITGLGLHLFIGFSFFINAILFASIINYRMPSENELKKDIITIKTYELLADSLPKNLAKFEDVSWELEVAQEQTQDSINIDSLFLEVQKYKSSVFIDSIKNKYIQDYSESISNYIDFNDYFDVIFNFREKVLLNSDSLYLSEKGFNASRIIKFNKSELKNNKYKYLAFFYGDILALCEKNNTESTPEGVEQVKSNLTKVIAFIINDNYYYSSDFDYIKLKDLIGNEDYELIKADNSRIPLLVLFMFISIISLVIKIRKSNPENNILHLFSKIGVYLSLWFAVHLIILLFFSSKIFNDKYYNKFWLFNNSDLGFYDFTEFLFYVFLPIFILFIIGFSKQNRQLRKANKARKFSFLRTALVVYFIWFTILFSFNMVVFYELQSDWEWQLGVIYSALLPLIVIFIIHFIIVSQQKKQKKYYEKISQANISQGEKIGVEKEKIEIIKEGAKEGLSVEMLSKLTKLSIEKVKKIIETIEYK